MIMALTEVMRVFLSLMKRRRTAQFKMMPATPITEFRSQAFCSGCSLLGLLSFDSTVTEPSKVPVNKSTSKSVILFIIQTNECFCLFPPTASERTIISPPETEKQRATCVALRVRNL